MTFDVEGEPNYPFGKDVKMLKLVTEQSDYHRFYCLVKDVLGSNKVFIFKGGKFVVDKKAQPESK